MNDISLPPFTPIPARPAHQLQPEQPVAAPKKSRKAKKTAEKKEATVAKGKKKSRPAKVGKAKRVISAEVRAELERPAKRTRSSRVAPLMLDAAQALTALAGLGKTEVATMRAIIELLNPLARPARKRVLSAVLALMGA